MSVSELTIKLVGFNEAQRSNFESILNLAESKLQQQWKIVSSEGQADFFIFTEEPLQATIDSSIPLERRLLCTQDPNNAEQRIFVNTRMIPSLHSLVAVLNRQKQPQPADPASAPTKEEPHADAQAVTATAPPITDTIAEAPDTSTVFYPEQGLLKALLEARSAAQPLAITANALKLWIDPVANVYYSSEALENLAPYCLANPPSLSAYPVTPADLQRTVSKADMPTGPLKDLIWYVAYKSSQGRLLQGSSPEDIVNLLQWPNFKLPECGNYVRLAAFMHSNALALGEIAASVKMPATDIYNFYNACFLIGLIEKGLTIQLHKKIPNTERESLLNKIRNRLK
jgi:hypothetical protein